MDVVGDMVDCISIEIVFWILVEVNDKCFVWVKVLCIINDVIEVVYKKDK